MINHWILDDFGDFPLEFLHFQNLISSNRTEITQKVPTARQLGDPPDQSDCSQRHGCCRHQIRGPAPEIIVYRYQLWIGEKCEKSSTYEMCSEILKIELHRIAEVQNTSKNETHSSGRFLFPWSIWSSVRILPYLAISSIIFRLPPFWDWDIWDWNQGPASERLRDHGTNVSRASGCGLPLAPIAVASCEAQIFFGVSLQPQGRPRKP